MRLWQFQCVAATSSLLWESFLAAYRQHVGGRVLAAPCSVLLMRCVCICLFVCAPDQECTHPAGAEVEGDPGTCAHHYQR